MSNFGRVHSSQQYLVCLCVVCVFGPVVVANSELLQCLILVMFTAVSSILCV